MLLFCSLLYVFMCFKGGVALDSTLKGGWDLMLSNKSSLLLLDFQKIAYPTSGVGRIPQKYFFTCAIIMLSNQRPDLPPL